MPTLVMPQSLSSVHIHAVFSTKHRQPFLADRNTRLKVHSSLHGISEQIGCQPIVVGGVADHVHLLVHLGRLITIAEWVKEVKRLSNAAARERAPNFSWQAGYGVFSVGRAELERVTAYIQNQEELHRAVSFEEEFRALLREHRVEWDERYVWD